MVNKNVRLKKVNKETLSYDYLFPETKTELVLAGNKKLNEVLDENTIKVNSKSSQLFVDTMKTYFENKIESIVAGSPKGVEPTFESLQAKYPTKTTGIYLVLADNNWYFWLDDFGWTSGGLYMQGVGQKPVGFYELKPEIQKDVGRFDLVNFTDVAGGWLETGKVDDSIYATENYKRAEITSQSGELIKFEFPLDSVKNFYFMDSKSNLISKISSTNRIIELNSPEKTARIRMFYYKAGSLKPTVQRLLYMPIAKKQDISIAIQEENERFKVEGELYGQITKSQNLPEAIQKDTGKLSKLPLTFVAGGWTDFATEDNSVYALANYVRSSYTPGDFQMGRVYQLTGNWTSALPIVRVYDSKNVELDVYKSTDINLFEFTPKKKIKKMLIQTYANVTPKLSHYIYDSIASKKYVDDKISETSNSIVPDYYKQHLSQKVTTINQKLLDNNGDSFIFITDTHWGDNKKNSPSLVDYIRENTDINKVVFGGDIITAYGGKQVMMEQNYSFNKAFNKIKLFKDWFPILGNHEFTIKDSASLETGATLTEKQTYNLIMSGLESYITPVQNELYYYLDNKAKGIRYIFINTQDVPVKGEDVAWGLSYGVSQKQVDWLLNEALNTNDSIVVVGHIPIETQMPTYSVKMEVLRKILEGYNNKENMMFTDTDGLIANKDFTSVTGKILFYLSGHNHVDRFYETLGVKHITCGCDAFYPDDTALYTRTAGTISEQLISVFVFDLNGNVNIVRVGAGNDRTL